MGEKLEHCAHERPASTMDDVGMSEVKLTEDLHSLETTIRSALAEGNHDRIAKIVHQLCHDYAYAVHQPHARNGGLIGLAAAAIALGAVSLL
jgi:vacuole morphology and inheritance protein 14